MPRVSKVGEVKHHRSQKPFREKTVLGETSSLGGITFKGKAAKIEWWKNHVIHIA